MFFVITRKSWVQKSSSVFFYREHFRPSTIVEHTFASAFLSNYFAKSWFKWVVSFWSKHHIQWPISFWRRSPYLFMTNHFVITYSSNNAEKRFLLIKWILWTYDERNNNAMLSKSSDVIKFGYSHIECKSIDHTYNPENLVGHKQKRCCSSTQNYLSWKYDIFVNADRFFNKTDLTNSECLAYWNFDFK